MKKYVVTAAALTLGTSALAWAPAEHAPMETAKTAWSAEKSPLSFSSFDSKKVMKVESAAIESSASFAKAETLGAATTAKAIGGSMQTALGVAGDKVADDGGITFAEAEFKSKEDVGGVQMASAEQPATAGQSAAGGVGGPLETAQGYPPCDPGRGDDRCIQLYERGVRESLAAWKGTESAAAMGGPFEPAQTAGKAQTSGQQQSTDHGSMNHGSAGHGTAAGHGGTTDHGAMNHGATGQPATAAGKTDAATATDAKPTPSGEAAGGIGGPIEPASGYPPCRPGRGDDRCIQLYERGVTGRRN